MLAQQLDRALGGLDLTLSDIGGSVGGDRVVEVEEIVDCVVDEGPSARESGLLRRRIGQTNKFRQGLCGGDIGGLVEHS